MCRRCKAFFSLAKELEDIHLGTHDELIPPKREDFFDAICRKSPFAASLSNASDQQLMRREAEKRWARYAL